MRSSSTDTICELHDEPVRQADDGRAVVRRGVMHAVLRGTGGRCDGDLPAGDGQNIPAAAGFNAVFAVNGKVDRLYKLSVGIDLHRCFGPAAEQPYGQPGADHGDGQKQQNPEFCLHRFSSVNVQSVSRV